MQERFDSAGKEMHDRLLGIDVARAVALIGMLMVHFGPEGDTDLLGRLYALPYGRASIPFVLVTGILMVAPRLFTRESVELGDLLVSIFSALLFTGPYPLVVWSGPLLWGIWIGRQNLRAPQGAAASWLAMWAWQRAR